MTSTTAPRPLNFTTCWTQLDRLTWDQLALCYNQIERGLQAGRSVSLWLGRWEKVSDHLAARGLMAWRADEGAVWLVGTPEMFEAIA